MMYPPVPPNCPMISEFLGVVCFNLIDGHFPVEDLSKADNYDTDIKACCAAVAHCAWEKEAKHNEVEGDYAKRNEANANADAWTKWGDEV